MNAELVGSGRMYQFRTNEGSFFIKLNDENHYYISMLFKFYNQLTGEVNYSLPLRYEDDKAYLDGEEINDDGFANFIIDLFRTEPQ